MMRAAVAVKRGIVRCEEVEIPEAGAGDVLVRTLAASICGSDLHMVNTGWAMHDFPAMSGHPTIRRVELRDENILASGQREC